MIEQKQELDLKLQILDNMSETASEYFKNLKNEKIALEQLRLNIIDQITSFTYSINTEFEIFEATSNLFNEVLERKKLVLKHSLNYTTYIPEEAKIFRYSTQEYLKILNKIENTKAYLNDILSMVIFQAPSKSYPTSQEDYLQNSNNSFRLKQLDELSQENFAKFPTHKLKENIKNNVGELPDFKEKVEVKGHKFTQIVDVPDHMPKDVHDAFITANLPQKIVKNTKLSKKIRKDFLEHYSDDLLYNPKYKLLWENIPEDIYRFFTGEIRKFAIKNNYTKFIRRAHIMMTYIKKFIRAKYTLIKGVDYISPDGGVFQEKIKSSYTRKWVKIKMVVNLEAVSKYWRTIRGFSKLFNYFFYKKYGPNTYKLYGEIKRYRTLDQSSFWREALKDTYDLMYFKCYQHEEDLMKHFNYYSNFKHNLDSSFVEEINEKIKELEDVRKEYARLVLNYVVI